MSHTQVLPATGPHVILPLHWGALKLRAEMMGGRSLSAVTVLMLLAVCPLPQSDGILRCALRGSSARMLFARYHHFYALQA